MRLIPIFLALFFLLSPVDNSTAEIYKWVDENGSVHFTDTPPPGEVNSTVVNPQPNQVEGYGKVPAGRATAPVPVSAQTDQVSRHDLPIVELFVTSWCGYCKKAEAYFTKRNIPFVKYDIEKDQQAARRKASLSNSRGVPFVLIGDVGIPGYSEAAFEQALRQYR